MDALGFDLTEAARTEQAGPLIGRSTEIDRVMQILSRRTKNNPALIGEPGVGKTAIVEGSRPADHHRRRAGAAAEQAADRARYRRAGGGHQVPRRVRRAAEEDRRRGQGDRQHPLHRRAAHAGRRWRGRRRGRCRQHPEAGALPRRAADDRRDDARRVPQVHRARRGAGAALPAGAGRRADRRGDDPDPDRRPLALRRASPAEDQRRGAEGRGEPGGPLRHRSVHAGQGDRPDRRGVVAGAHVSVRRAAESEGGAGGSAVAASASSTRRSPTRSSSWRPSCATASASCGTASTRRSRSCATPTPQTRST